LAEHTPRIERYYRAANLFVFPSINEGLPNAVLEAMACALPCVAAQAPGSAELVRNGVTGATFAPRDAPGLQRALTAVIANAATFGRSSRRLIVDQFDIEQITDQYEALYARMTAPGPRRIPIRLRQKSQHPLP
jgi:glycosyltransferase involved in cell wall biosynthesis